MKITILINWASIQITNYFMDFSGILFPLKPDIYTAPATQRLMSAMLPFVSDMLPFESDMMPLKCIRNHTPLSYCYVTVHLLMGTG